MRTDVSRPLLVASLLVAGGFTLACGGMSSSVASNSLEDLMVEELEYDAGDHRAEVLSTLADAWVAAETGDLGMQASIDLETTFGESLDDDGRIDETELAALRAKAPAVDAAERAPRTEELRSELERKLADAAGDFEDWDMPEDVSRRLAARGWEIRDCTPDDDGNLKCYAAQGDRVVRVYHFDYIDVADARADAAADLQPGEAYRRDGSVVLTARVVEGSLSEEIRDALFPRGADLRDLGPADVRLALARSGWTVDSCEAGEPREGEDGRFECLATRDDHELYVAVGLRPSDESWHAYDNGDGTLGVSAPHGYGAVRAFHLPAGETLLEDLVTGHDHALDSLASTDGAAAAGG